MGVTSSCSSIPSYQTPARVGLAVFFHELQLFEVSLYLPCWKRLGVSK